MALRINGVNSERGGDTLEKAILAQLNWNITY
jgi:hypothetical protein